jgi:mono/diheme cytochrome c family protein
MQKTTFFALGASIFTLISVFTSCKKEYVDTDETVCFQNDVLPIFQSNCTQSGCHNATDKKKGYDLTSFAGITAKGVKAGDYRRSMMYQVLVIPLGEAAMPQSPYPRLNDEQIATIALWIQQGAKNTSSCGSVCDTSVAKYNTQVKPLLNTYCNGCHATAVADVSGGGTVLDNYASVNDIAPSIVASVKRSNNTMPKNGNKLSDCNISIIDKWIREGALNN